MSKRYQISPIKFGQSPGTLTYVGKETLRDTKVTLTVYNDQTYKKKAIQTIDECAMIRPSSAVTWINVDGINNTEVIAALGQAFNLHPLLLEDVLNTEQKPKIEYYDDNTLFVVMKMLSYNAEIGEIEMEHVSLVLGKSYVISFQEEREGDAFDPVRKRLEKSIGKTRRSGADYLLYSLIDTIIDNYFLALESIGEKIEVLEEAIINRSSSKLLTVMYAQKRSLIFMRKAVWPVREILSSMVRGESSLIAKPTIVYLRDVYDHTIQVIDTIESYRDLVAGLLDIYLSSLSNRMNNIMKVLTIVSTIFMPLSFIVGVYGMNFDHMPELHWRYGYLAVWVAILISAGCMLAFFRRKGWM